MTSKSKSRSALLAIYVVLSIAILVVLDILAGKILSAFTRTHSFGGDVAAIDYTLKKADQDVVIVGNSAVLNSLMPSILQDSIGLSVYNAASNAQTLPFFLTMTSNLLERHKPKALIVGIRENLFRIQGPGERYNILTPYYGQGYMMVDSCLEAQHPSRKYLLKSTFYRYNTIWWRLFLYSIVNKTEHTSDGFVAKPVPPVPPDVESHQSAGIPIKERVSDLRQILSLTRRHNIPVIGINPPALVRYKAAPALEDTIAQLQKEFQNFIYINDREDPYFDNHKELFFDSGHLNSNGAKVYSSSTGHKLKDILSSHFHVIINR